MTKKLLLCGMSCLCLGMYDSDKTTQLLTAYAEQRWGKVRTLLRETEPSAQRKLIQALYYLNAPRGDKGEELEQLEVLWEDKNIPEDIRLQAMLTYARNVELMQMRSDLYSDTDYYVNPELIEKNGIREGLING